MHRSISWVLSSLLMATVFAGCVTPATQLSAPPLPASAQPAKQAADLSPEHAQILAELSSQGPAPELANEVWFNSEPLKLADLRGQVVIVEFWTYG